MSYEPQTEVHIRNAVRLKKKKKKNHKRNTITYEEDMMMSQGPRAYL